MPRMYHPGVIPKVGERDESDLNKTLKHEGWSNELNVTRQHFGVNMTMHKGDKFHMNYGLDSKNADSQFHVKAKKKIE